MRILVCGDRDWWDKSLIFRYLRLLHRNEYIDCIIEGDSRGADKIAGCWANKNCINNIKYPAKWKEFGRVAGPIRNREMIKEKPDLVVAFHDNICNSKGTKDMLSVAAKNNIESVLVTHENFSIRL